MLHACAHNPTGVDPTVSIKNLYNKYIRLKHVFEWSNSWKRSTGLPLNTWWISKTLWIVRATPHKLYACPLKRLMTTTESNNYCKIKILWMVLIKLN